MNCFQLAVGLSRGPSVEDFAATLAASTASSVHSYYLYSSCRWVSSLRPALAYPFERHSFLVLGCLDLSLDQ